METAAHIVPAAEIAAFPFLEDELGDRRCVGSIANGLRQVHGDCSLLWTTEARVSALN
jgi:hypothetical protein